MSSNRAMLARAASPKGRGEVLLRLHEDQHGSMSIVTVFAVMFLAMLLGMVMNVGRHVDGKIRMQNAADSAAYSGGVVICRGMNTLAFTNHLLCDVFAVTAFLREARDQNSASYAPDILAAWQKVAPVFASSNFPKFTALASAIQQKVPLEQRMVDRYSAWAKSVSDQVLPMMEEIPSEELIPKYQRAVLVAFPDIAQSAARETAQRNGDPNRGRGTMFGVLWRTDAVPVGGGNESGYSPDDRSLPVVDPEFDSVSNQEEYVKEARSQRYSIAHKYLEDWNNQLLSAFDSQAKMCQFAGLWRSFTCGYLDKLLNEEYPRSNLPMVIREIPSAGMANTNALLEKRYTYISVVYWKKLPEMLPGLFRNPLEPDAQAFAEVHLFIPRNRLGWIHVGVSGATTDETPLGGVPGEIAFIGTGDTSDGGGAGDGGHWVVGRVGGPTVWNLLNQSWNCQLAPATNPAVATVLQSNPHIDGFDAGQFTLPSLGGATTDDLQQISPH
jgi:hypothetical protein